MGKLFYNIGYIYINWLPIDLLTIYVSFTLQKDVEPVCHSFHALRLSHCPGYRNEQRWSPTLMYIYNHPYLSIRIVNSEVHRHPIGRSRCFVFDNQWICEILMRQNQSVQLRLLMYITLKDCINTTSSGAMQSYNILLIYDYSSS